MELTLKEAFKQIIQEEFIFLLALGYHKMSLKKDSCELFGTSYTIDFVNKKFDRSISISTSAEKTNISTKLVSILILKNLLDKKRPIDDYISFELLCKQKEVDIKKIKQMNNIKTIENLNLILKEYAILLRNNFLEILQGKEWAKGLYPEWR